MPLSYEPDPDDAARAVESAELVLAKVVEAELMRTVSTELVVRPRPLPPDVINVESRRIGPDELETGPSSERRHAPRPHGHVAPASPPMKTRLRWLTAVWRFLGQDKAFMQVSLNLAPGERIILSSRYHIFALMREFTTFSRIMQGLLVLAVGFIIDRILHAVLSGGLWWMTLILWLMTIGHGLYVIYKVLAWRAETFIVTTRKLIWLSGVFNRVMKPITIPAAVDVQMSRSIVGRVFGYGTLKINNLYFTVDEGTQEVLDYLPRPQAVYRAIVAQRHVGVRRASADPGPVPGQVPRLKDLR